MPRAAFYTTEALGPRRSLTPEGFLLCEAVALARTGLQLYAAGEVPVAPDGDGVVRVERDPEEVFRPETIASFAGKPVVVDHPAEGGEVVDVNPANWRRFAVGTVLNPRRGEGAEDDLLLGDLLLTDERGIRAVNEEGLRQVSCGYESDYEETAPGRARQTNIVGNHVAIVREGRCGGRCAIHDRAFTADGCCPRCDEERGKMGKRPWLSALLLRASRARDAAELAELEKEGEAHGTDNGGGEVGVKPGEDLHIHVHPSGGGPAPSVLERGGDARTRDDDLEELKASCAALQGAVAKLQAEHAEILRMLGEITGENGGEDHDMAGDQESVPPPMEENEELPFGEKAPAATSSASQKNWGGGTRTPSATPSERAGANMIGDLRRRGRAGDSSALAGEWQETLAMAEILSPGVRAPTFDAAAPREVTAAALAAFRRRAIDRAYAADEGMRRTLDALVGGEGYAPGARMTSDAAAGLFRAAATVRRDRNNSVFDGAGNRTAAQMTGGRIASIADLNRLYAERTDRVWGAGGANR